MNIDQIKKEIKSFEKTLTNFQDTIASKYIDPREKLLNEAKKAITKEKVEAAWNSFLKLPRHDEEIASLVTRLQKIEQEADKLPANDPVALLEKTMQQTEIASLNSGLDGLITNLNANISILNNNIFAKLAEKTNNVQSSIPENVHITLQNRIKPRKPLPYILVTGTAYTLLAGAVAKSLGVGHFFQTILKQGLWVLGKSISDGGGKIVDMAGKTGSIALDNKVPRQAIIAAGAAWAIAYGAEQVWDKTTKTATEKWYYIPAGLAIIAAGLSNPDLRKVSGATLTPQVGMALCGIGSAVVIKRLIQGYLPKIFADVTGGMMSQIGGVFSSVKGIFPSFKAPAPANNLPQPAPMNGARDGVRNPVNQNNGALDANHTDRELAMMLNAVTLEITQRENPNFQQDPDNPLKNLNVSELLNLRNLIVARMHQQSEENFQ